MKLTKEKLMEISWGAEEIFDSPNGIEFTRFNKAERELYIPSAIESRTHTPAGVQLRFKTDGTKLYLNVECEKCLDRSFFCIDVFCNNEYAGGINNFEEDKMVGFYSWSKYPLGCYSGCIDLGAGEKELRIVLPWSVRTYIKEINVEDATYIIPVNSQKSIIMYGDSITHGYDSIHPSNSYSMRLAEAFGYEAFLKAVGGECFFPELAAVPQARKPEFVTVAYGTNDWSKRDKNAFDVNSKSFIEALCKNYPESKIFVLSPIWRKDNVHQNSADSEFDDIHYVERTLQNVCKNLDNVYFIRGWEFIPQNENLYGDLRLHPNDDGFKHYADSLYNEITKYLNI